jgi:hypothetical protein
MEWRAECVVQATPVAVGLGIRKRLWWIVGLLPRGDRASSFCAPRSVINSIGSLWHGGGRAIYATAGSPRGGQRERPETLVNGYRASVAAARQEVGVPS